MSEKFMLVVGMALVTYFPRMMPMVVLPGLKLPSFIKQFLDFVPVAVLSALIFPGIIFSTGHPLTALIGGMVAFILALKNMNLMIIVLGAIFTVLLMGVIV